MEKVLKNLLIVMIACGGSADLIGCASGHVAIVGGIGSTRPRVGYVRLLNLSSDSVWLSDRGRKMVAPVAMNEVSSFTTCPGGTRVLVVKGKAIELPVNAKLKPGASTLIVLSANEKMISAIDDARTPQNSHNLKLIYLNADGSAATEGPSVTLTNSGTRLIGSSESPSQTLKEGRWTTAAKGLTNSEQLVVAPDTIYDLVLIKADGGRYSELILSHLVIEKPKLAGTSKTN